MIEMSAQKEYFLRWMLKENKDENSPLHGFLWGKDYNDVVHFADLDSYGKGVGDGINDMINHLDIKNDGLITKRWKQHIQQLNN